MCTRRRRHRRWLRGAGGRTGALPVWGLGMGGGREREGGGEREKEKEGGRGSCRGR